MKITFRGTGDSMGVPRVYCHCAVCSEARDSGLNRRLRSSVQLQVEGEAPIWIDCGPSWSSQMEAAGLKELECILITHAHFDHIGGLPEWADSLRWLKKRGTAYATKEVIAEILARFPWLSAQIEFLSFDQPIMLGLWRVSSWKVNHGKNGHAYAFRFEHSTNGKAWVYCSDSIGLTEEQQQPLAGLELLVLGTSFHHEPFAYEIRSVYDVTEAIPLIAKWKPKRTLLTHLSHDIDLGRSYPLPEGMAFARTGMSVNI